LEAALHPSPSPVRSPVGYDIVEEGTPPSSGWGRVCLLQMLAVDAWEQHRALLARVLGKRRLYALTTAWESR